MQKEPVMIWGTMGTLTGALLMALMKQYLPDLGGDLMTAIVEWVVFFIPVLGGLWMARRDVISPATLKRDYVRANNDEVG